MKNLKLINKLTYQETGHLSPLEGEILSFLDENTILNYVASDFELTIPKGFSIQYSASKSNNFTKPYFPHKTNPIDKHEEKTNWEYDFSFIGDERPDIRKIFFMYFKDYIINNKDNIKYKLKLNDRHFHNYSNEEQNEINKAYMYSETIRNTRFNLCPAGTGYHSIRFYETLAVGNIPVYIGERKVKFPLDWLIDWDKACIVVSKKDLLKKKYIKTLDNIRSISDKEVDDRRKYIFEIYNKYLHPNKTDYFNQLVKEKIEKDF